MGEKFDDLDLGGNGRELDYFAQFVYGCEARKRGGKEACSVWRTGQELHNSVNDIRSHC